MLKKPNWQTPDNIHAYYTTRTGGVSQAPFDSNNPAMHVGDNLAFVNENRKRLSAKLPSEPIWLTQTHSNKVAKLKDNNHQTTIEADASTTQTANTICAVMTADCLPILLCNQQGTEVAAIHAGWRGLANGIIEKTLSSLSSKPTELLAWLGPAISKDYYEVGIEVKQAFQQPCAFTANKKTNHFQCDLVQIAKQQLNTLGLENITESNLCTYSNPSEFFSYRRDDQTGRIASLIYLTT